MDQPNIPNVDPEALIYLPYHEEIIQLIEGLNNIQPGTGTTTHAAAEDLLLAFFTSIGYPEVNDAFNKASDRCGFHY